MISINLNLNFDLYISGEYLTIKRDTTKSDNAFQLNSDGIYVDKRLFSTGNGFVDQSGAMVRIGYLSGYDRSSSYTKTGRISANNVVHRTFTKVNDNVVDYRSSVDCFKPGDMIRIPRSESTCEYFLIVSTSYDESSVNGNLGNSILETVSLGTFSWCGSTTGLDEYRGGV